MRPIAQLDGETGFAEVFFDDVFVPDEQVLGGVGGGWGVAMSTAGSERGLSLRSPARYTEAARRLVDLYAGLLAAGDGAAARRSDEVARAYIDAEAYQLHTYWTASRVADGHPVGAEASCNKIFWSETDLAIHAALGLLGAGRSSWRSRPRRVAVRHRARGSTASCSRWPARSTPAPTRSNATWWPNGCSDCRGPEPVRFALTEQQVELRDAVRAVLARECTTADVRTPDAGAHRRWSVLAELGATGLVVPEASGGIGLGFVDLVGVLEEAGWAALPEPLAESAALAAPLLASAAAGAADGAQAGSMVRRWLPEVAGGGVRATVGGIAVDRR